MKMASIAPKRPASREPCTLVTWPAALNSPKYPLPSLSCVYQSRGASAALPFWLNSFLITLHVTPRMTLV